MAVTSDIIDSYRRPRAVIARKLAAGVREDRALATLFGACGLIFVSQWPGLARAAHLEPEIPLDVRIGGALLGVMFLLPPLCYAIGGISHLLARRAGGNGSYFGARLALFWALLAVTPLMLLHGLVGGLIGPGTASLVLGLGVLGAFGWIWAQMLIGAER